MGVPPLPHPVPSVLAIPPLRHLHTDHPPVPPLRRDCRAPVAEIVDRIAARSENDIMLVA